MAVSKTRAKLVDVARQLFAKKGVDDTTMNDIAVASKKGRRTLYTVSYTHLGTLEQPLVCQL